MPDNGGARNDLTGVFKNTDVRNVGAAGDCEAKRSGATGRRGVAVIFEEYGISGGEINVVVDVKPGGTTWCNGIIVCLTEEAVSNMLRVAVVKTGATKRGVENMGWLGRRTASVFTVLA